MSSGQTWNVAGDSCLDSRVLLCVLFPYNAVRGTVVSALQKLHADSCSGRSFIPVHSETGRQEPEGVV